MALYGIDESHFQSTILGQDFVILKATEGISYVDPTCDAKYQANLSVGRSVGVYHFADMGDPIAEANYFVDNIQGYLGTALLALDFETNTTVTWAKQWLDQVYARTQVRPLIYMSASTTLDADWSVVSNDYALWVAGYPTAFDMANPPVPQESGVDMPYKTGTWPFATIWQYSSSAGTLDRDIAYMTPDAWNKFAQGDRNVTPSAPEPAPAPSTPDQIPITQDQPPIELPTVPPDLPATPTVPDAPTETPDPVTIETGTPAPEIGTTTPVTKGQDVKAKLRDLIERAGWTFIQAAAAALIVTNGKVGQTALVAAFAAGVSAVKTVLKQSLSN